MIQISTITQKGQVTIPIGIRKFLKVRSGDKVAFIKTKNQIVIKPAVKFYDLKGSVKTRLKYSDQEADKAVSHYIKKTYVQKAASS